MKNSIKTIWCTLIQCYCVKKETNKEKELSKCKVSRNIQATSGNYTIFPDRLFGYFRLETITKQWIYYTVSIYRECIHLHSGWKLKSNVCKTVRLQASFGLFFFQKSLNVLDCYVSFNGYPTRRSVCGFFYLPQKSFACCIQDSISDVWVDLSEN